MHLQRTVGNQAVQRLLKNQTEKPEIDLKNAALPRNGHDFSLIPLQSPPVPTQLAVNQPEDKYEQEADQIADQMMAAQARNVMSSAPPPIQRVGGELATPPEAAPASVDRALAGPGRVMEPQVRQDMEQRLGHDFSQVRLYSGAAAEQSAADLNATAYTVGRNIIFGAGGFAIGTHKGRRLLAHELTHVVQQSGGAAAVQCSPAPGPRWRGDVRAARYRGQLIAKRIRVHTKVSKEVRAKIKSELAYFDGVAKEAYLQEVRPALWEVGVPPGEFERPGVHRPRPVELISSFSGPPLCAAGKCETIEKYLEKFEAPLKEKEKQETQLQEARIEAQLKEFKDKTKDWGEDQDFAVGLLEKILRVTLNPDPRAVSDRIRQPILDRYRDYLKAIDQARLEACAKHDPGLLAKVRGRASGDDPCVSWFDPKKGDYAHGPSELMDLERALRLNRETHDSAADKVYWEVLEYRKKTDPYWLEQARMAGEMVSGLAGLGSPPGGAPGKVAPPPAEAGYPSSCTEAAHPNGGARTTSTSGDTEGTSTQSGAGAAITSSDGAPSRKAVT